MTEPNTVNGVVVYRGQEHAEISIPVAAILKDGRLDIFDEIKDRDYFKIYSKGDNLIFQCGGYVGLIPINGSVVIEVAPRVRISNLDRVLNSVTTKYRSLSLVGREYGSSSESFYLVDFMADSLVSCIDEVHEWGRHKEYTRKIYSGNPRSGRFLIKETVRLRAKTPIGSVACVARFERSSDNVFNACLKFAVERLIDFYGRSNSGRSRVSRLNIAWLSMSGAYVSGESSGIVAEVERRMVFERLSTPYLRALPLACAILRGFGPSQRSLPPSLLLDSLLFNLADAFEAYIRNIITEGYRGVVLDGNFAKPQGAKKLLFNNSTHKLVRKVHTTPDVVLYSGSGGDIVCVLDVKYKPYSGVPERNDINQVLAYALAYGVKKCGLVYLSNHDVGGVEDFGSVGGVSFYGFSIALNSDDLLSEEQRFVNGITSALADD
ncbi:5-methylcytosine restriction system specificity protein McrC [Pseudomonas soli]|uniref:5-methylcytosine restriction system specificity protein McrC n=1 Tax=Pseudomonas soli TaxID=1306993 RepID=UPI0028ABC38E|nr:hypothetical protein [Pseudomonas soli]